MNKLIKTTIIVLCLLSAAATAKAAGNLILEVTTPLPNIYGGETKTLDLAITNNTGNALTGKATFHADYNGICNNNIKNPFDGVGIWVTYNGALGSAWANGDSVFTGLNFQDGKTQAKLEVKAHQALCPGRYDFSLVLGAEGKQETSYSVGAPISPYVVHGPKPKSESELEKEELLKEIIRLLKLIISVLKRLIELKN